MSGASRAGQPGGVRRAGPRDVEAVTALWSLLLAHHLRIDPHYRTRADAEGEFARFVGEMIASRDAAVFAWDGGGAVTGFASVRLVPAPPVLVERRRGEILDLVVRPEARRGGVGRALVGVACTWLSERGVARAEVRVHARNPEGQAFWRALGWGDYVDVLERRL